METSREDVSIAIRSAFLRKDTQQRFSLFVLVIIAVVLILVEKIETKPLNYFRSIFKDFFPNGPSIFTLLPARTTFTFSGISILCLPIRDIFY